MEQLAFRLRLDDPSIGKRRYAMETVQTIHDTSARAAGQGIPRGDEEWFDALFLRYSPALYRIAFRKLGNVEDAEDAVQDALLSAFRNMHQFRGDAQFSTWLGSIVLNAARMRLRRRINHTLVSLDEQSKEGIPIWPERLEDSAPSAEETLRETRTRENLERVVKNLPVGLRVVFRLRVFQGLTTSEAATALGVPEGTMKARFFRASRQVTADMRALEFPNRCERRISWRPISAISCERLMPQRNNKTAK